MKRLFMVFVVFCALQAATAGAVSFTNNGNGTVTDNGTGLMWQQGEPGTMTWANALTYCEGLSLGGQTDWRLPNIKELESITDDTKYRPAIDTTYFPNANASYYCSSATYAGYTSYAWDVHFYYGYVYIYNKSYGLYVRCVRGGQSGSLCNLAISPSSQTFTSAAGTGTVTVTTSGSSCTWTATSSLSWVTITSGSSGTGSGTVTISVAANTTGASRTGNLTIAGQSFAITQSGEAQNNCAATLSGSFLLHEPYFTINGSSLWLDLQYAQDAQFPSTDIMFKLSNAGGVTNLSDYSNCQASTLSVVGNNYVLHIPILVLGGTSYWLDLTYVPTSDGLLWFKLTGIDKN